MEQTSPFGSLFVVGGGAWGTALANLVATKGIETTLWAREEEVVRCVSDRNENAVYLPGIGLDPRLSATHDISVVSTAAAILMVAPAQYNRAMFADLRQFVSETTPFALCSKGIETATGLLMTEVLAEVWPEAQPAVLSGPSFAADVARGMPTAVTLACPDRNLGERWVASVGAPHFRTYLSDDLIGAELGGAVKNVLAIAAGVVVGRELGESARAALIARGFAEFQRLGVALGAKPQTMAGLSGLGDLILTASSPQSRNMSLGIALGQGRALQDVLGERNSVAEGVATAPAVVALAQKAGVETPICSAVAAIVSGEKTADEIIAALLSRPFREET